MELIYFLTFEKRTASLQGPDRIAGSKCSLLEGSTENMYSIHVPHILQLPKQNAETQ